LADRRKDEFLAMLAHELRNPLAAIRIALQLQQRQGCQWPLKLTHLRSLLLTHP
jgi:signal transduction histidine kinase